MEVLFRLRLNKRDKTKQATIYCRITVNGRRADPDFSTFIKVMPEDWSSKAQQILGTSQDIINDNEALNNIRNGIKSVFNKMVKEGKPITAPLVKATYLHSEITHFTLLQVLSQLITAKKEDGLAKSTIKKDESKYRNVEKFLKSTRNIEVLPSEFTLRLADDLAKWLKKNIVPCSHNHAMKHVQLIKQALTYAVRREYISVNPLEYVEMKFTKPKPIVFLTDHELQLLENHKFASAYLERVKDLFLFQIYTGFAYVDMVAFDTEMHLQTGMDKKPWIYKQREKSDEWAILPFFRKARQIYEKYDGELPIISNQKYNQYLKEVALIIGIEKSITSHVARKTAGHHWLNAGVPIESVARMLGHSSTKITQSTYAKVQEKKIAADIKMYLTEIIN